MGGTVPGCALGLMQGPEGGPRQQHGEGIQCQLGLQHLVALDMGEPWSPHTHPPPILESPWAPAASAQRHSFCWAAIEFSSRCWLCGNRHPASTPHPSAHPP